MKWGIDFGWCPSLTKTEVMKIEITVSDDHQIVIKVDDLNEDETPWLEVARILMEAQNVALIQSSYLTAKEKNDGRSTIKHN